MKKVFFMILVSVACGCSKRGPEGTQAGDCDDSKDNDFDGRYDCDDDGCAMDTICVAQARKAELARREAEAAAEAKAAKAKSNAPNTAEPGPVFDIGGLMVQSAQNSEDIDWNGAQKYCDNLNLLKHTDWRLPTREEAVKIIESGQLKKEASYVMWTSTVKGKKRAVIVGMSGAINDLAIHYKGECRARCVRGDIAE